MPLIVAIDGPSGVGKSTTSKRVAQALGIPHIDTGAMYRAIALKALRQGVALNDEESLRQLASATAIEFSQADLLPRVMLDGEDVTAAIRAPEVSMAASTVSALPAVRRVLVNLQQEFGRSAGGVLEGRDIGTKVFPETPHKFFLTARPEVRAQRRFRELQDSGQAPVFQEVLDDIARRDHQDSTRADSPLKHDETYAILDTSDMSRDAVVEGIVNRVLSRTKTSR